MKRGALGIAVWEELVKIPFAAGSQIEDGAAMELWLKLTSRGSVWLLGEYGQQW